jgi:hypothetical protein
VAVGLVVLLGLANLATQRGYLAFSAGEPWDGTLRQLQALRQLPETAPVLLGLQDTAKLMLAAHYTRGHPTQPIGGTNMHPRGAAPHDPIVNALVDRQIAAYRTQHFDLGDGRPGHEFKQVDLPPDARIGDTVVILPAGDESVLNGSQQRAASGKLYVAARSAQRNTLVEVDSSLGHIILPGRADNIALWQREPDFAGSPGGLQGIGRHVLFEVLNPVPGSRLLLDYSSGSLAGEGAALPPAVVVGTERLELGFAGRGAGRVLSEAITPREIDGRYYLALDLGADPTHFRTARHGLAALYHTELGDDPRSLCGFVRNISLITPEQVEALQIPSAIGSVPKDLLVPGLFFSGIAEDGWVADQAWFELALPGPSNLVHVTGIVPGFSPKILGGTAKILIDGRPISEGKLYAGPFDVTIPIPEAMGPREIGFEISGADTLPPPDGRLVTIQLISLSLGWHSAAAPAQQN